MMKKVRGDSNSTLAGAKLAALFFRLEADKFMLRSAARRTELSHNKGFRPISHSTYTA
jgi:hypothetical protein